MLQPKHSQRTWLVYELASKSSANSTFSSPEQPGAAPQRSASPTRLGPPQTTGPLPAQRTEQYARPKLAIERAMAGRGGGADASREGTRHRRRGRHIRAVEGAWRAGSATCLDHVGRAVTALRGVSGS